MNSNEKRYSIRSPAHSDYENSNLYFKRDSKNSAVSNLSPGLLKQRSKHSNNNLTNKFFRTKHSPSPNDSNFLYSMDYSRIPKPAISSKLNLYRKKNREKDSLSSNISHGNLLTRKINSDKVTHNFDLDGSDKTLRSRTPQLGFRLSVPSLNINVNFTNHHFQTPKNFEIYSTKNVIPLNFNKGNADILSNLNQGSTPAAITLNNLKASFPSFDSSKHSTKPTNFVRAYAANTYQGLIRNYNEDRVSIILKIVRPKTFKGSYWPCCSFFGIYDGHGGNECADYLRTNLHQFIIKDQNFPNDPQKAIHKGFERAEYEFLKTKAISKSGELLDKSGSCALICMIIDNKCYIGNVGDSRAIMSVDGGKSTVALSSDHRPNHEEEMKRIQEKGGKIYQTKTPTHNVNLQFLNFSNTMHNNYYQKNQFLIGPHRVLPGRLSVSRAFGDVEAKFPQFGGKRGVIIAVPEITCFEIKDNLDFIIIGCDGIYDHLSNEDVTRCVYITLHEMARKDNINSQTAVAVDLIMKSSLLRKTLDNITCLMIALPGFEKKFNEISDFYPRNITPLSTNNASKLFSTLKDSENNETSNDMKLRMETLWNTNQEVSSACSNDLINIQNEEEKESENEDDENYMVYQRQDLGFHSGIEKKISSKNFSEQNFLIYKTNLEAENVHKKFDFVPDITAEKFNKKHNHHTVVDHPSKSQIKD